MIRSVQLIVGMEVHIELATRSKMFSRVASPAHPEVYARGGDASDPSRHGVARYPEPNTLIDPVVLALPGALPVMNLAAVELSMMVGLALGCSIAPYSKWDRKSYFYADLPKNYQISQYDLPLCFDGSVMLPPIGADGRIDFEALAKGAGPTTGPRGTQSEAGTGGREIGIIRAHLEEDAGKLLHELPGGTGGAARGDDHASYADYNRAGTPLLEIVTQPDFRTADECVVFSQMLRNICRFLGASEGIMQRGHMRFEPNINCILTLDDGRTVRTPIVEVKNLNSFKSLKGAIEFELREQPRRWEKDGIEFAPGTKTTRGWDDVKLETFIQREKEEAHDYRYFPDPDLPPVVVSDEWRDRIAARVPELPLSRARRYIADFALSTKEAATLTDERDDCLFYEAIIDAAVARGVERSRAGKLAANFILQSGLKRANERARALAHAAKEAAHESGDIAQSQSRHGVPGHQDSRHGVPGHQEAADSMLVSALGITPAQIAAIISLREANKLSAAGADELFGLLCSAEPATGDSGFAYETPGRGGTYGPNADPEAVAQQRGLIIVVDEGALDAWCDRAIAAEAASVQAYREGKAAALGRVVGAAMKLAGGKADAKTVRERLERKLK